MVKKRIPSRCPSCGLEGSLKLVDGWIVCEDDNCGRAFKPIIKRRSKPKPKSESKLSSK